MAFGELGDGREVLEGIVGQRIVEAGVDGKGAGRQQRSLVGEGVDDRGLLGTHRLSQEK